MIENCMKNVKINSVVISKYTYVLIGMTEDSLVDTDLFYGVGIIFYM